VRDGLLLLPCLLPFLFFLCLFFSYPLFSFRPSFYPSRPTDSIKEKEDLNLLKIVGNTRSTHSKEKTNNGRGKAMGKWRSVGINMHCPRSLLFYLVIFWGGRKDQKSERSERKGRMCTDEPQDNLQKGKKKEMKNRDLMETSYYYYFSHSPL
jgi:hypothetical protein